MENLKKLSREELKSLAPSIFMQMRRTHIEKVATWHNLKI
jgi:hypothetical protein